MSEQSPSTISGGDREVIAMDRSISLPKPSPSRWFSNLFDTFFGSHAVCIPQLDEDPRSREESISYGRTRYDWSHEIIGTASMVKSLPFPEELPRLAWLDEMVPVFIRVLRNTLAASKHIDEVQVSDVDDREILRDSENIFSKFLSIAVSGSVEERDLEDVIAQLGALLGRAQPSGNGDTFDDYRKLYKVIELDLIAKDDQFLTDEIFGWYRIGGSNPMRLKKAVSSADLFPELTDNIFCSIPSFEHDTLAKAASEDRLYYVDYPELSGVESAKPGRYIYAPTALFAVPSSPSSMRESLLPLAVRCTSGARMYTPLDDKVAWLSAKLIVQNADIIMQTVVYHLSRCHLLIEVFNCSTHRALAPVHPLYKLLMNHFYGTALVNWTASKVLVRDDGILDKITAPKMSVSRQLAADSIQNPSLCFNDWMPDADLSARGVMSKRLHFPYRDDALSLWEALLKFVKVYIDSYYAADDDVRGDTELETWCEEITRHDGGNLPGFGELGTSRILTKPYLVRVISMIIFTASAQHAAINNPQSTYMQFAPAKPYSIYAQAPETDRPYESIDAWVSDAMPPLKEAHQQLELAELLSTMQYSTLGQYRSSLKYAPKTVQSALKQFQRDLHEIAVKVGSRNIKEQKMDLPPYEYLNPKNIAASINI